MIKVYANLNEIMTLRGVHSKDGRRLNPGDLDLIAGGSVVFDEKEVLWVGKSEDLPAEYQKIKIHELAGHVLTPELVDSHTHVVFGGDRAQEYIDRLNGKSYEEIAATGGGILFTMNQTNAATIDELYHSANERIERIYSYGVGTIEIKSGYGLNFEKEYQLSLLIARLKKEFSPRVQIYNTYMAAHDVPKSFNSSSDYMEQVVLPLLENLSPLKVIDAVDIFHEINYFNQDDVRLLFTKARQLGLDCKIHADELNDNQGAQLAVEFQAISADHLLKISPEGVKALGASQTIATLLPGTAFFINKPLPPARALLDAGSKVALATDYNPGSCHCDNLLLVASMAAPQLKLNQAELWSALVYNSAHALGLKHQGAIIPGMKPRFALFKAPAISHLTYNWGRNFSVSLL